MMSRVLGLIVVITLAFAATAQPQLVRDMTPDKIREAIALGNSAKELGPYRIQEKARWSWPPSVAVYTTPFLRVALAANVNSLPHLARSSAGVGFLLMTRSAS